MSLLSAQADETRRQVLAPRSFGYRSIAAEGYGAVAFQNQLKE